MKGMKKKNRFGWAVVQSRFVILIAAFILLIPSVIGYLGTKTNYDMLSYLPDSFETMKGQSIMEDEFGTGGFSFIMVQDMPFKDVAAMKKKMEKVDHVEKVLWYDDFADISIPVEVLPDKIKDAFYREDKNETLLMVVLKTGTSSDESGDAIEALRKIAKKQCFISGMTAGLIDTKALADKEAPVYVILAVILCLIVLQLTMDSFMAPLLFLVSIGMAVLYNMGTNWIFGKISYVTKALAAVLQLGVTLDYSIFLWHSYIEQRDRHPDDPKHAMATAINVGHWILHHDGCRVPGDVLHDIPSRHQPRTCHGEGCPVRCRDSCHGASGPDPGAGQASPEDAAQGDHTEFQVDSGFRTGYRSIIRFFWLCLASSGSRQPMGRAIRTSTMIWRGHFRRVFLLSRRTQSWKTILT